MWLAGLDHHHQDHLRTAGCAWRSYGAAGWCENNCWPTGSAQSTQLALLMASPKAIIVTGGPEGHGPAVEVEGEGLGALGLVCVHRAAA